MDLFKYEYDIGSDKTRWKACILANNSEEGVVFLQRLLPGKRINIFSIESIARIDGVTDEVIQRIISSRAPKAVETSLIVDEPDKIKKIKQMLPEPKPLELKVKKTRMKRKG